ncbi:MAG: carotenoid 1,2-hydratase [Pseudomonadota bacterium]
MSDTGDQAISIIGFIGSVFSPWYRWSGRRSPQNHCCINVALYGRGGRWTMTDRGRSALRLTQDRMDVGPSHMAWDNDTLVVGIDEISVPHFQRIRGEVRVIPSGLTDVEMPLTQDGAHVWRPFAPTARIEVEIDRPGWQWGGHGYFDANFGLRALEEDFSYWTWARFPAEEGSIAFYDAVRRDGTSLEAALHFCPEGRVEAFTAPPLTPMRRSLWTVRRETRADPGSTPRQAKAMLDAPFYTRSIVSTRIGGQDRQGVHEALDLNRFASPWLKPMLAVKVPRRQNWTFRDTLA